MAKICMSSTHQFRNTYSLKDSNRRPRDRELPDQKTKQRVLECLALFSQNKMAIPLRIPSLHTDLLESKNVKCLLHNKDFLVGRCWVHSGLPGKDDGGLQLVKAMLLMVRS